MRRLLSAILSALLPVGMLVYSASPASYEYWIDNDIAAKETGSITGYTLTQTIPATGLSPGLHWINYRLTDDAGGTGGIYRTHFYLLPSEANAAEWQYWLDEDKTSMKTGTVTSATQALDIDLAGVAPGLHFFNYRCGMGNNEWGGVYRQHFYIMPNQVNATKWQYWFDNDSTSIKSGAVATGTHAVNIDLKEMPPGLHFFNYRYGFGNNEWGGVYRRHFYVTTNPLNAQVAQYWFDDDKTTVKTDSVKAKEQILNIDLAGITPGPHYFNLRYGYGNNEWGGVYRKAVVIMKTDGRSATGYRHYLNGKDLGYVEQEIASGDTCAFAVDIPDEILNQMTVSPLVFSGNEVSSERSGSVNYRLQLNSELGWGMPMDWDVDLSHTFTTTAVALNVEDKHSFNNPKAREFVAAKFTCADQPLFFNSDSPVAIDIYKDGVKLQEIPANDSTGMVSLDLAAGEYFAVLHDVTDNGTGTFSLFLTANLGEQTVASPEISMSDDTHVRMFCETPGSTIRYTLDGSDPTAESAVYTEPVYVESNLLVKAVASAEGMLDSQIVSFRVDSYQASAPVYSFVNQKINISSTTEGAVIRYTVDSSDPTEASTVYTEPFLPDGDCEIRAYASKEGMNDSPISVYTYIRGELTLSAPTFSLDAEGKVVIVPAVEDGETRYTVDGSDPDVGSSLYTAPFEVPRDCVIKAYTTHVNYFDSPVGTYIMPNIWESAPVMEKDFRNRTITISQNDGMQVAVTIDGNTQIMDTPATIEVVPSMTMLSAIALTKTEGRKDSEPVTDAIVFHRPPVLSFDGHAVHYRPAEDEPQADGAEGWAYFNDNLRQYGEPEQSIEVYEFGHATAHLESDRAFRSDDAELTVDFFNTGRKAGARNGHRLSETFGTWGDKADDYTYLRVTGEVGKEDLQFIGTLPNLTTLHLDPYTMAEEACDSVFAGTRIETIFSTAYPQGMLKGMPRLTTLMWGLTGVRMPEGIIEEASNPNILLWVTDAANAPADVENVVVYDYAGEEIPTDPEGIGVEGRSESISLVAGYPFNAHMPVTAAHAEFVKEFTQSTEVGVCRGWETISLPFEAQRILHESGSEVVPFEIWNEQDTSSKPFWLYEATSDGWLEADIIKAGVPYIISMPNNPDYIDDYKINGTVSFSADNVILGSEESAPLTVEWKDGMLFSAIFMPTDESGILSLNTAGEGGLLPGSTFIADACTLPFGAYLSAAGSRKAVPVFVDSGKTAPSVLPSGLTIDASTPGTIRISSMRDRHIRVHDVTGAIVARTDVKAGESVFFEGLTGGVYLVAGQKIMVK